MVVFRRTDCYLPLRTTQPYKYHNYFMQKADKNFSPGKHYHLFYREYVYEKWYPVLYYLDGIEEVDKFLQGDRLYEYGIDFSLESYEKYVVLKVGNLNKPDTYYIQREHLIPNVTYATTHLMKVIKPSRFVYFFTSGAFGSGGGIAGMLISKLAGKGIEKIRSVVTETVPGNVFILPYYENGQVRKIRVEIRDKYQYTAEVYFKQNWTPNVPSFENASGPSSSTCFVATVAYNSQFTSELHTLRHFRDSYLANKLLGSLFIKCYYKYGQRLATFISHHPTLKKKTKLIIDKIVQKLKNKGY